MSKHQKFDPDQPSGRIAFDDRGRAVWQWRTDTGDFRSDIDTQTVRALQDATDVKLAGVTPTPAASHDPYRSADAPHALEKKPRRTLDDMRRLSEEIKRAREPKKL